MPSASGADRADDYLPYQQLRLQGCEGKTWQLFDDPIEE
jgi:hypothetical protein